MIFDIILVLAFIITLFIGYKSGFLQKFVKLASGLCGLVFAVVFCGKFTSVLVSWGMQQPIKEAVLKNVIASDAFANLNGGTPESVTQFITELGIPNFLAEIIAKALSTSLDANQLAVSISESVSYFALLVIGFLILLFGTSILFFILKFLIKLLRSSTLIKFVDGILGIAWSALVFIVVIYVLFLIVSITLQFAPADNSVIQFITGQLKLNTDEFGLAKYMYENNILGNLFKLFF